MSLFLAQVSANAAGAANKVATDSQSEVASLISGIITQVPLWIAAFVLLVLTFFAAKMARSAVENKILEKGIEEEHREIPILAGRSTYAGVLIIGITASLKVAGIDITSIIAAIAFGLGFALKDLIMNFIAGIMILMARQFTIGDFIKVGGTMGKIIEIQARATILQSFEGTKIVVPNALLFTDQVTSLTSNPFRRFEVVVGVDYSSDLKKALMVCQEAVNATPKILAQPKPSIMVKEFGDSSINIVIKAWCESRAGYVKIKGELMKNIKEKFDEFGIEIPWPYINLVDRTVRGQDEDGESEPKSTPDIKLANGKRIGIEMVPNGFQPTGAESAQMQVAAQIDNVQPVVQQTSPSQTVATSDATPVLTPEHKEIAAAMNQQADAE